MCFGPSTLGAGAKTRLESRIKKFTPHCVCRYNSAENCWDGGDCCSMSCSIRNGHFKQLGSDGKTWEWQHSCQSVDDTMDCLDPNFVSFKVPLHFDPVSSANVSAFSGKGAAPVPICGDLATAGTLLGAIGALLTPACNLGTKTCSKACADLVHTSVCDTDSTSATEHTCSIQQAVESIGCSMPRCPPRTKHGCRCRKSWAFGGDTFSTRACVNPDKSDSDWCAIVSGSCRTFNGLPVSIDTVEEDTDEYGPNPPDSPWWYVPPARLHLAVKHPQRHRPCFALIWLFQVLCIAQVVVACRAMHWEDPVCLEVWGLPLTLKRACRYDYCASGGKANGVWAGIPTATNFTLASLVPLEGATPGFIIGVEFKSLPLPFKSTGAASSSSAACCAKPLEKFGAVCKPAGGAGFPAVTPQGDCPSPFLLFGRGASQHCTGPLPTAAACPDTTTSETTSLDSRVGTAPSDTTTPRVDKAKGGVVLVSTTPQSNVSTSSGGPGGQEQGEEASGDNTDSAGIIVGVLVAVFVVIGVGIAAGVYHMKHHVGTKANAEMDYEQSDKLRGTYQVPG